MKGTRALSFLLALALLASLVIPGSFALPAKADGTDSDMQLKKTAVYNEADNTYTITLEAYATGAGMILEEYKDIPTDIVLVLDRSGSMAWDIGTVSFKLYEDDKDWWGYITAYHTRNQDYYEYRHNGGTGNLWHKLADDSYVSVSVTKVENLQYNAFQSNSRNYQYYGYANNLYEKVGETYEKVELTRKTTGNGQNPQYTYTYAFSSNDTIVESTGWNSVPSFGEHGQLYYATVVDPSTTVYTYTYTDADGNTQLIGTSIGATTVFTPTLYQRVVSESGGGSRMAALKTAAQNFVDSVAKKAKGENESDPSDDVQHRLAVVSYASNVTNHTGGLLDMTVSGNVTTAKNAIGGLTADGGTMINEGISTANSIFAANPIDPSDTSGRQRVLIVFTDGAPGMYGDWQDASRATANSAISNANTAKNTHGATVYTIGIFSGANASSPGSLPTYTQSNNPTDAQQVANSNRFMHLLSSNYPKATSMTDTGSVNPNLSGDSYYLSASDANTLNSIFQQIANKIENSGSSITLGTSAVVKDIIAPQFALPDGATASDITLETYKYTGVDKWEKNADTLGATATVVGAQVSVTGFDFSENWCGAVTENGAVKEYRGNKLVISFKVKVKEGFLGGNDVYTNDSAGVYEDSTAENPLFEFERPTVDIPIKPVTVTAEDKNVYLLGSVDADSIVSGTTVKVGNVTLDLSRANYGLEDWQTAYVNITENVTNTGLANLTADSSYTVAVTVSPKTVKDTPGAATTQSGSDTGNINVFKPVLTYKDSEVYYGDDVPTDFTANLTSTVWKHGDSFDTSVTMIGTAPDLTKVYTPDGTLTAGGTINTKQDVPVDVTVKIGNEDVTTYTTFQHTNCSGKTCAVPAGSEFLLHVKTCTLTITKQGGAAGEPYVFTVKKDGNAYTQASITGSDSVTIYELPVGAYTIEEDTGWSWRYTPGYSGGVTLSSGNPSEEITCRNTLSNGSWLNGFSDVVQNIFGEAHS